ncbi:hypothetical protein GAGA_2431 [Paraglaciecola agarilytica NO2]|uniref:Uncharacterized protein n=1 Tax=Paraglaciecola agarilytica NO2 TaxID=1125747 RepID=A0ABQ0I7K0_9ALTE|nr:hypothetical protein GAGA_2431 [Paraglaciecola agarilytica NO2]
MVSIVNWLVLTNIKSDDKHTISARFSASAIRRYSTFCAEHSFCGESTFYGQSTLQIKPFR